VVRPTREIDSEVFQIDPEAKDDRDTVALVAQRRAVLLIETPDGHMEQLPAVLDGAVRLVAEGLASGKTMLVADASASASVSPTGAAQLLGVSRPMVTRWIGEGLLPDVPVGSHHRIPVNSVLSLRDSRARAGHRAVEVLETVEKDPETASRVDMARERARKRLSARSPG
jgi:excisionase family DNA binding protein